MNINVDPAELAKFGELAHRWWDPQSDFKPLHDINPLRLNYINRAAGLNGKTVLDVGCGTGTLAIAAQQRVGFEGQVTGVDASPEMIDRARHKAKKAGADVGFHLATAQQLPFANEAFDVVLSTTMLHCLPPDSLGHSMREMRRVLKAGGRLLLVDFGGSKGEKHSYVAQWHHHRNFDLRKVVPIVGNLDLIGVESEPLGFSDLHFIRGTAPTEYPG